MKCMPLVEVVMCVCVCVREEAVLLRGVELVLVAMHIRRERGVGEQ